MWIATFIYQVSLLVLVVFAVHRFFLAWRARQTLVQSHEERRFPNHYPKITVQLPLFNERFVVTRLLQAVSKLDYPKDRFDVQVLDDSTDETSQIIERELPGLRDSGLQIEHIQRRNREGFKAGALLEGLERASGDFLAILDADFVPPPNFLLSLLPYFEDERVAMVQARWDHLNPRESYLTYVQSLMIDGHFLVEQKARSGANYLFNFNGTAGIWRKSAIVASGGWQADTLTEDLDLSYRAQLAGWKFRYAGEVVAKAELPKKFSALKTQQYRWSKGSAQTFRKLVRPVLSSRLSHGSKREALFHLLANAPYLFLVSLTITTPLALAEGYVSQSWKWILWDGALLFISLASLSYYFFAAKQGVSKSKHRAFWDLLLVIPLGIGLSFNNACAFVVGLFGPRGHFLRTPKSGDAKDPDERANLIPILEVVMALYLGTFLGVFLLAGWWTPLPFLFLFFLGYLYVVAQQLVW